MLRGLSRRGRWLVYGAVTVLSLVMLVVAFVFVQKWAPDWFAETKGLDAKGEVDARQGIRTVSVGLLVGFFTALAAIFAVRTYRLNRANQLNDRFATANEQLDHARSNPVRLGAVYSFEGIARESKKHHLQVIEVLIAYVRHHISVSGPDRRLAEPPEPSSSEQAAMKVLGRRTLAHEEDVKPDLDLSSRHLMGADLRDADLRDADLRGSDLTNANLTGANLRDAQLADTEFRDARYDHRTVWPEGFVPDAAGARLDEGYYPKS
jgi:hypothetical protein